MFGRKNQNVLADHYTKLVSHDLSDQEEEDFITLKRADHALSDDDLPASSHLSKRKQKMGESKKLMSKYKQPAQKLVFDEEGQGHQVYEPIAGEEFEKELGGEEGVREAGRRFAEQGLKGVREGDVRDREEAKEKRREKKRKRKEKERGVSLIVFGSFSCQHLMYLVQMSVSDDDDAAMGPTLTPAEDEDGYVSPDFDLPTESEEEAPSPPSKRRKGMSEPAGKSRKQAVTLEDEEMMALQMLRSRR
jgi:ATP-dependent RNA helicase DDX10/DBP4